MCPRCLTPSQNIEDLPFLEPSVLFSLSRYGRVASWHRVGVGGGVRQAQRVDQFRVRRELIEALRLVSRLASTIWRNRDAGLWAGR